MTKISTFRRIILWISDLFKEPEKDKNKRRWPGVITQAQFDNYAKGWRQ